MKGRVHVHTAIHTETATEPGKPYIRKRVNKQYLQLTINRVAIIRRIAKMARLFHKDQNQENKSVHSKVN